MRTYGPDSPPVAAMRCRRGGLLALLAAAAVLAAGCGPSAPHTAVASAPTGSSASASAAGVKDPLAFARCMRANGLPDFPDPDTNGANHAGGGGQSGPVDPHSTAFQRAQQKCRQYLGPPVVSRNEQGVWSVADKLKYAACMRQHGLPDFKDPDQNGAFPPPAKGSRGLGSPEFQRADKACAGFKPNGAGGGGPGGGS